MSDMTDYVKSINATQVSCADAIVATMGSIITQVSSLRNNAYSAGYASINVGSYNAISDTSRINAIRDGINASGAISKNDTAWMDALAARISGNVTIENVIKLDGREIYRDVVQQDKMTRNMTGKSGFAF
jgi:hypothetical protein